MDNIPWNKIEKTNSCWNWLGELNEKGYGRIFRDGKRKSAHKYLYEILVGIVPFGLEIDHTCRNRKCVNPKHLETITHGENIKRAWIIRIKNTPKCPHGHPYSGDNLYDHKYKGGKIARMCKKCRYLANIRWRTRLREQRVHLT